MSKVSKPYVKPALEAIWCSNCDYEGKPLVRSDTNEITCPKCLQGYWGISYYG